jgi:hypothetical protein
MSENEAQSLINDARDALQYYINSGELEFAENVCEEYFGLEPDYLFELMP